MKTRQIFVIALVSAITSTSFFAQDAKSFTLKIGGYASAQVVDNSHPNPQAFHAGDVYGTFRPEITYQDGTTKYFLEADFASVEVPKMNWMKELYVEQNLGNGFFFRVGRFKNGWIYVLPPAKFDPTVIDARVYTSYFGTGARLTKVAGPWTITADLTGDTLPCFQVRDSFENPEGTFRTMYTVSKELFFGATVQGAKDVSRGMCDFTYARADGLTTKVVFEKYDDRKKNGQDLYVYTGKRVKNLEIHAMVDLFEHNRTFTTIGVRVFAGKSWDGTIDYRFDQHHTVMARVRYLL